MPRAISDGVFYILAPAAAIVNRFEKLTFFWKTA